jgi:hypothetical protein
VLLTLFHRSSGLADPDRADDLHRGPVGHAPISGKPFEIVPGLLVRHLEVASDLALKLMEFAFHTRRPRLFEHGLAPRGSSLAPFGEA